MFKAVVNREDEPTLVVLGLSPENIGQLRLDNPIAFNLDTLGLPPMEVAIAWKHDDGMAGFPKGFEGTGLAFSTDALNSFIDGGHARLQSEDIEYFIMCIESEFAMEKQLREAGLIGANTQVQRSGFAPSDVPPGAN